MRNEEEKEENDKRRAIKAMGMRKGQGRKGPAWLGWADWAHTSFSLLWVAHDLNRRFQPPLLGTIHMIPLSCLSLITMPINNDLLPPHCNTTSFVPTVVREKRYVHLKCFAKD